MKIESFLCQVLFVMLAISATQWQQFALALAFEAISITVVELIFVWFLNSCHIITGGALSQGFPN